ncbi:hypothetical protein pipiens_005058 [Culex pipiens pipiens]|uniref:RRM domain-containing protein n=1 Tax=Culex pipiens pipiens TaxID=38569 RepID=A0ABD1CC53_CULPP
MYKHQHSIMTVKKVVKEEINHVRENLKRSINIQQQVAEFAVTALRLMMDKEKGSSKGFGYVQYVEATGASEAMTPKNGTETEGGDG